MKEQSHYQPEQKQTPQQRGEGIRGVPPPQGEQAEPQWDMTRVHPLSSLFEQDANLFGRRAIGSIQRLENRVKVIKDLDEAIQPNSHIEVFRDHPDHSRRIFDPREIQQARRQMRPKDIGKNKEEAYLRGLEDALTLIKDHISGEPKFGNAEKGTSNEGESDVKK